MERGEADSAWQQAGVQGLLRQRMVGRVSRACHHIHIHGSCQLRQRQIHLPAHDYHGRCGCTTPGLPTCPLMALLVLPELEVSFLDIKGDWHTQLLVPSQQHYIMRQHR